MKVVYDETPSRWCAALVPLLEAGANLLGACCGSTPDHIRAFRAAMDEFAAAKGARYENQTV
jgi:5-methyltetrahydrofolate--homocysteine methyltransferase